MNKISKLFFATLLTVGVLTGCGGSKLPTNSYEKVKFAFNGVEKSFKNPKAGKKSLLLNKRERLGGSNPDDALSTIFNLYKQNDINNDFLDDIEYNQPPMVQFQYIKKVLEKVGSGYEFGTKYYDTVTGDVYLDIQTGQKSKNADDKFNYTFGLGMDINITENDLITADVSFDIKIVRGQEEYKTKWYVAIELDYDMANNSPNYVMTMVTENNESELPYYQHYTYEYDYVDVKNSQIDEWRKFCMDNNNRLIKDANHPNFDSYATDESKYKVDACSWYKNGTYYKNKRTRQLNGSEAKTVGEALYSNLGLNATEINADAFFNKASTPNSVLKTCYQEFNKIAKEDIIYSLLTKLTKDKDESQQKQKTAIRAMNEDLSGGAGGYHIAGNTTVKQLFTGFNDFDTTVKIRLVYIDQNGGLMDEITDLESLYFFFKVKNNRNTVMFDDLNETLESTYNRLVASGEIGVNDLTKDCEIVFLEKGNEQINGVMSFYYSSDLPSIYVKPEWPGFFKTNNVPEYDGAKAEYKYTETAVIGGYKYYLDIRNSTYEEGEAYCAKLRKNGFEESQDFAPQDNEVLFKKQISEEYDLYVAFKFGKNINQFLLTAWKNTRQQQVIPEQPFHVYLIGDCNNWGKNGATEFNTSYEDNHWKYVLSAFHVDAGESFAFVTNPDSPGERYFGYGELVEDPRGFIEPNLDKGPFAIRAVKSFTANFSVDETGLLHLEFTDTTQEIQYLTIVGSFNGWSTEEGTIEMEKKSDYVFEKIVGFDAGVEFKIMQNHSWDVNYGYNEIKALQSADMKARFGVGEYGNVLMKQSLTFKLTATIDDNGIAFKVDIIA